jgi:hypothetical protein
MLSPSHIVFRSLESSPKLVSHTILTRDSNSLLKRGIWLYFFLLLFEGALRKWFLPGLATPLLIVRDPVAIWLLVVTWQRGLLPANYYITTTLILGVLGIFTAVLLGHGSLVVALYGARILLFHFPLMFVIGRIFNREDVVKMGKAIICISIPMALLIAVQFYSPQSSLVNRGVGGDMAGAGFSGAMGYFRPPGTFSFTNGVHLFFGLSACFVCYFWINREGVNRLALLAATIGLLSAIPFSISRSLLLFEVTAMFFMIIAMLRQPKYLGRLGVMVLSGILLLAFLSKISFLQTPIAAFTRRFDSANDASGGVQNAVGGRYYSGFVEVVLGAGQQPFFGYGLGMGTNAGNQLLTGHNTGYLISEGEWGRLIGEMGPLMGLTIIFLRLSLSVKIALACYRKLLQKDLLPWILLGYTLQTVPQAQWAQPTNLGFSTLIGGLIMASLRVGSPIAINLRPFALPSQITE